VSQFRPSVTSRKSRFTPFSLVQFVGGVPPSVLTASGLMLSLFCLGCEQTSSSAIDPSFGPPALIQASTSVSAVNTDTINVGTTRKPEDVLTIALTVTAKVASDPARPLPTVQMRIISPDDHASLSSAILADDGSDGDQLKGDGIFTGRTSFRIERVQIGVFTLEITAVGSNDFRSNTVLLPLTIYRGNHPPLVSLIEAADTVKLANESQVLVLRLRVTDEDGIGDISRAFFNSYRPDGSASSGNPFQMYDDGSTTRGDEKAGDGIFGLLITLPPTTQPGTYRFEFQAVDRSNAVSNILVHSITVKP